MIMCQTIIHFITSKQLRYLESGYIYYLYLLQYLQHSIYYLDIEILKIETFTP